MFALPAILPAHAAAEDLAITGISIGVHGAVKVGRWTPVEFDIAGPPGATVESAVIAPDPDGSETSWKLSPVVLDGAGQGHAEGVFKIGRLEGTIRIDAGGASASIVAGPDTDGDQARCRPWTQDVSFVGVLGAAPGFEAAFATVDAEGNPVAPAVPVQLLSFASADELPDLGAAYDSLNVLVLAQSFDLDQARSSAIADWVRQGGHVVLALGKDPQPFSTSPLAQWAPITAQGPAQFLELATLLERVPASPRLAITFPVDGVRVQPTDGIVLAGDLVSGPLATRCPYGLGRVTALAVDWNDTRLATWPGLPGLCLYLADLEPRSQQSVSGEGTQLRPTGISELATQLAAALDHFSSVNRPSYWTVILFAAAFMLLVGPLDYLLVHRVLKQPRLTWFTFPAWIVFAAAAATMGADRLNSTDRQANQFDLLDIDVVNNEQQVQSWITVYSPEPRRLETVANVADWLDEPTRRRMTIGWSGTPEPGFGGMYRAGGLNLANPPYRIDAPGGVVENVPIAQWSTKALSADWRSGTRTVDPLVTSELADDGTGLLTGTFTHRLPEAITDYCVAYGTGVYFPGATRADHTPAIAPGIPWSPADRITRRLLDRYLQGLSERYISNAKASESATKLTAETYDPLGLDPYPVARMLTYFKAGAGPSYTGLSNHSLERADLSRLLPLKRAVLFGRIASTVVRYDVDGVALQPQEHWTYVRIVLPVRPGKAPSLRERGILELR